MFQHDGASEGTQTLSRGILHIVEVGVGLLSFFSQKFYKIRNRLSVISLYTPVTFVDIFCHAIVFETYSDQTLCLFIRRFVSAAYGLATY